MDACIERVCVYIYIYIYTYICIYIYIYIYINIYSNMRTCDKPCSCGGAAFCSEATVGPNQHSAT